LNSRSFGRVLRFLFEIVSLSIPQTGQVVEDGSGPVVSMTSHSRRLRLAHLTIESIGRGTLLPSRMILNVSETEKFRVGRSLKRLERRGLEINFVQDLGPHKKWFFTDARSLGKEPLVTADDDVFYPKSWLAELTSSWNASKTSVVANHVTTMSLDLDSYGPQVCNCDLKNSDQQDLTFDIAVGGKGVAYPPEFIGYLQDKGREFMNLAPKQDDIWLSMNAWERSIRVEKTCPSTDPIDNYFSTYLTPLYTSNRLPSGNLEALYRVHASLISSKKRGA
jgi:hypothetical protein